MKTLFSLLFCLILFSTAQAQKAPTPAEEKAILEVHNGLIEAWNKHDTDLYFSYLTPEAQWVNVVGMWWHNTAEHRYALDIFMKLMFNKTTHTAKNHEIRMLRPDLALLRHTWEITGWVMPDGRDMSDYSTGVLTLVLEKRKGKWLVIDGHNTSIDKKAQDPALSLRKQP